MNHLVDQISSLNDRMDEFTCHIEEMNSKLSLKNRISSQQSLLTLQAENCNGSAHTSYFMSGLENGPGLALQHSLSSSQLANESTLAEEVQNI